MANTIGAQDPRYIFDRIATDGSATYVFPFDYPTENELMVLVGPSENFQEWIILVNGVDYEVRRLPNGGEITVYNQGNLDDLYPNHDEGVKYIIVMRTVPYQQSTPIANNFDSKVLGAIAVNLTMQTQQLASRIHSIEEIPGIADPQGNIQAPNERDRIPKIWNDNAKNLFKGSAIIDHENGDIECLKNLKVDGNVLVYGVGRSITAALGYIDNLTSEDIKSTDVLITGDLKGNTATFSGAVVASAQISTPLLLASTIMVDDAQIGTIVAGTGAIGSLRVNSTLDVSGQSTLARLHVTGTTTLTGDTNASLINATTVVAYSIEGTKITASETVTTDELVLNDYFKANNVQFYPSWVAGDVVEGGVWTFAKDGRPGNQWSVECSPLPTIPSVNVDENRFAMGFTNNNLQNAPVFYDRTNLVVTFERPINTDEMILKDTGYLKLDNIYFGFDFLNLTHDQMLVTKSDPSGKGFLITNIDIPTGGGGGGGSITVQIDRLAMGGGANTLIDSSVSETSTRVIVGNNKTLEANSINANNLLELDDSGKLKVKGASVGFNINAPSSGQFLGFASDGGAGFNLVNLDAPTGGGGGGNVNVSQGYLAMGGTTTNSVVSSSMLQRTDDILTAKSIATTRTIDIYNLGLYSLRQGVITTQNRDITVIWDVDQSMPVGSSAPLMFKIDRNDSSIATIAPDAGAMANLELLPPYLLSAQLIWQGHTNPYQDMRMYCAVEPRITGDVMSDFTFDGIIEIVSKIEESTQSHVTGTTPFSNGILTIDTSLATVYMVTYSNEIVSIAMTRPPYEGEILILNFTPVSSLSLSINWPLDWLWPGGTKPDATTFLQGKTTTIVLKMMSGSLFANVRTLNKDFYSSELTIYGNFSDYAPLSWINATGLAMYAAIEVGAISGSEMNGFVFDGQTTLKASTNESTYIMSSGGILTISIDASSPLTFVFDRDETIDDIIIDIDPDILALNLVVYVTLIGRPGLSTQTQFPLPAGCYYPGDLPTFTWSDGLGSAVFVVRDSVIFWIPNNTTVTTFLRELNMPQSQRNALPFADSIYDISNCLPPSASVPNSLVFAIGEDANGDLELDSTNIIVDSNGAISTNVIFNNVVNRTIRNNILYLSTSGATTTLDLALANTFQINRTMNTVIDFINDDPTMAIPFVITLLKDASANQYTVEFTAPWKKQDGSPLVITNDPNAIDVIIGVVYNGTIYTDIALNDFKNDNSRSNNVTLSMSAWKLNLIQKLTHELHPARFEEVVRAVDTIFTAKDVSSYVSTRFDHKANITASNTIEPRAATPNALCACTATGQVAVTNIQTDSNRTITSSVIMDVCTFNGIKYPVYVITPAASITLSMNDGNFATLLVDRDMTLNMENLPTDRHGVLSILLKHDNTANSYTITVTGGITMDSADIITNEANAEDWLIINKATATGYAMIKNKYS